MKEKETNKIGRPGIDESIQEIEELGFSRGLKELLCYYYGRIGPSSGGDNRVRNLGASEEINRDALKYISNIHAVSGQGGHDDTFNVACKLVIGFGLDRISALRTIRDWNQTNCVPRWTDKELQHKIESALIKRAEGNEEIGTLALDRTSRTDMDGGFLDRVLGGKESRNQRSVYSAQDLLEGNVQGEGHDWLWDGYVARGNVTLLAGRPKGGKSTLLFGLARSLLDGNSFLKQTTKKSAIVFLTEEAPNTVTEKLHMFDFPNKSDVHFVFQTLETTDLESGLVACDDIVEDNENVMIVIDTFSAWGGLHGSDENNATSVQRVFNKIRPYAKSKGAAVVCIHHTRKLGPGEVAGPSVDKIRGSSAIVAASDIICWLADAPDGKRWLTVESRSLNGPKPKLLALDLITGLYTTDWHKEEDDGPGLFD